MENPQTIFPKWPLDASAPLASNVFVVQRTASEEIVLTFGNSSPIIFGTLEQQSAQVKELARQGTGVEIMARVVMSVHNARELHAILGQQLQGQTP